LHPGPNPRLTPQSAEQSALRLTHDHDLGIGLGNPQLIERGFLRRVH
jgi:hypothetical protein